MMFHLILKSILKKLKVIFKLTYLALDPPASAGASGHQTLPPTSITSHSANTTPTDSHLLQSSWNVCRQVDPSWSASFSLASIQMGIA